MTKADKGEADSEKKEGDGKPAGVTPLPKIQVFCICTVQMAEAMNVDLLFPFLAFMVEDMGYTGEKLGYHAGLLAASFCGAQFCTSVPWGMISDRYGRKIAIILGTLGAGIGMFIFGFAKTYAQAVVGRIIGGLLCGNLGVVKSFLTEITDDTNRSNAFYLFSLSWAVGSVFAPLLGGMLCKPAEKYPFLFSDKPDSLFVEYPYLLPCLLVVSVNVISSLLCTVFMIETVGASKEEIQARIQGKSAQNVSQGSKVEMTALTSRSNGKSKTGDYARLPSATDGDEEGFGEEAEGDELAYADARPGKSTHSALHLPPLSKPAHATDGADPVTAHAQPGLSPKGTGRYSPLRSVPETHSLEILAAQVGVGDALGVSTAMPSHGNLRNRSRSSSTAPYVDLEQQGGSHGTHSGLILESTHSGIALEDQGMHRDGKGSDTEVDTEDGRDLEEADTTEEVEEVCCPAVFHHAAVLGGYLTCTKRTRAMDAAALGSDSSALDASVHSSQQLLNAAGGDASSTGASVAKPGAANTSTVLTQRVVVLATLNYGMICASSILMDETLPLFLKLDAKHGGFGFSSAQIGMLLSTGAAGMMFLTVVCMPLTNGVSNKLISFVSLGWSIPLELAFPLIALLNNEVLAGIHNNTEHMWLLWPILMIINAFRNFLTCLAFTSAIIMVNHSVTDEYLGAVNGLGQSMGALARSLGPAVGGLLWSLSTRYNFVYLNFIAVTLLYLLNIYVSDLVPKSLDFKKKRRGAVKAR